MSVFALSIILGDLYQSLFHISIPMAANLVLTVLMLLGAVGAFFFALRFQLRRRLLPIRMIVIEALIGITGAVFLFFLYGVLVYSSIG